MKKILSLILALLTVFSLCACGNDFAEMAEISELLIEDLYSYPEDYLDKDGSYDSIEDVVEYLTEYGTLPSNYITKDEAKALGWKGGGLDEFAPGKCIGGDKFGNYEGLLPSEDGVTYWECDIGTLHADSRGAKRMVYSSDGHIYYTEDHYASFVLYYSVDG